MTVNCHAESCREGEKLSHAVMQLCPFIPGLNLAWRKEEQKRMKMGEKGKGEGDRNKRAAAAAGLWVERT